MNVPKRVSNMDKVIRRAPWTLRDVIEAYSGKSYEEVKREQLEKRKKK